MGYPPCPDSGRPKIYGVLGSMGYQEVWIMRVSTVHDQYSSQRLPPSSDPARPDAMPRRHTIAIGPPSIQIWRARGSQSVLDCAFGPCDHAVLVTLTLWTVHAGQLGDVDRASGGKISV